MGFRPNCLVCATAPAASLGDGRGDMRKSCQRQTTQQFQLCIFSSPQRPHCFVFAMPLSYFPSHASFPKHLLIRGAPQEVCGPGGQLLPPLHIQDGFANHFTGT